jgi:hypothetical protein
MEKLHGKKMQKDLDIMESRLGALEAASDDRYKKSMITVIKGLTENQKHLVEEFEHLKKAIDLLTLQVFKVERKLDSIQ